MNLRARGVRKRRACSAAENASSVWPDSILAATLQARRNPFPEPRVVGVTTTRILTGMTTRAPGSIFLTTVPAPELDPIFVHIRDHEACAEDREYIEGLWRRFQRFADSHFHDQFQRDFPSRTWEMQLACFLLDNARSVESNDTGPDFIVQMGRRRVWFEAVCPEPGTGALAVAVPTSGVFWGRPETAITLRYSTVLRDKIQARERYLDRAIVQDSDCYVIAISGAKLDVALLDESEMPFIVKTLYGVGDRYFEVAISDGAVVGGGFHQRPGVAKRTTGATVSSSWFCDESNAGISAVLYQPNHVKNRPEVRGGKPGSDLILVHNALAARPGAIRGSSAAFVFRWLRGGPEVRLEPGVRAVLRLSHDDRSGAFGTSITPPPQGEPRCARL